MGTICNDFGCVALSEEELVNTEGGFWPLLIAGTALLLSSCQSNSSSGNRNTQINIDCTNCNVTVHGDTVKVYPKK